MDTKIPYSVSISAIHVHEWHWVRKVQARLICFPFTGPMQIGSPFQSQSIDIRIPFSDCTSMYTPASYPIDREF